MASRILNLLLLVLLMLACGTAAATAASSAATPTPTPTLPPQWRWLAARVPPGAPRTVLRDLLEGMPDELCRLGPSNMTRLPVAFMDQVITEVYAFRVCAVGAQQRRSHVCRCAHPPPPPNTQLCPAQRLRQLALAPMTPAARMRAAAAWPATLGGAAALLALGGAPAAAALQQRLCDVLSDPGAACGWGVQFDAPYARHLNTTGTGGPLASAAAPTAGALNDTAAAAARLVRAWAQALPRRGAPLSLSDPLEGASEAVVQGAMRWFSTALPAARARVLSDRYLPPPLYGYAAAALARLPEALCGAAAGVPAALDAVARLPTSFRDELCPLANVFKLGFGGVGLSTYTLVAEQLVSGVEFSSSPQSDSEAGGGITVSAPPPPLPLPTAAAVVPAAPPPQEGGPLRPKLPAPASDSAGESELRAAASRAAARDAANRRAFSWLARACFVLYSPEVACNPEAVQRLYGSGGPGGGVGSAPGSTSSTGTGNEIRAGSVDGNATPPEAPARLDFWSAYDALRPFATPAATDALLLRVNERRFAAVAALAAALRRMPAGQRASLAAALGGRLGALPSEIRAMPPAAAAALLGPLRPWVCLIGLDAARARIHGDLLGAISLAGDVIVREVLRLDAPAALIAAVLGDSTARPAFRAVCAAIDEARARVRKGAAAGAAAGQAAS